MSTRLCLALAVLLGFGIVACQKPAATDAAKVSTTGEFTSEDDKTLYALGLALARNLEPFNLSDAELKTLEQGLSDYVLHRPTKVDFETQAPKIQAFAAERAAAVAKDEEEASKPFIAAASGEPGAQSFDSGLVMKEISPGTGDSPKPTDSVRVNYEGKLRDGTVFDSTTQRGQPAQFLVNRVIPCWTEALPKMKVGEKAKLTCPAKIAYGNRGSPGKIKPGATLQFEVELVQIVPQPEMPPGHLGLPPGSLHLPNLPNPGGAKPDAGKEPAPPPKNP